MLKYTVFNYKACPAEGIMKEMLITVLFKLLCFWFQKEAWYSVAGITIIHCEIIRAVSVWAHMTTVPSSYVTDKHETHSDSLLLDT